MDEPAVSVAPKPARMDVFVLLLLALSLSANVAMGVSMMRLTASPPAAAASPRQTGPAVGSQLPPIDALRFGGSRETIAFSDDARPTLLYVFTPTCKWCGRNLANFHTLVERTKNDYRILAVSLDPDVQSYLTETNLNVPVFIDVSRETVAAYGLGSTPQTLVISPEGKVLKSWIGAYGGATQRDVEETFSLKLPGVSPPKVSN